MTCEDVPLFKIIDKVLIGEEDLIDEEIDIGNLILDTLFSRPDFIGQIDAATGETITFREMKEKSIKLALYLIIESFGQDTRITICTDNHLLAYLPLLASLYIGAIINPWSVKYIKKSVRVMSMLIENDPDIIFIDEDNVKTLRDNIQIIRDKIARRINPRIIVFNKSATWDSVEEILEERYDQREFDGFFCENIRKTNEVAVSMVSLNTIRYPGTAKIPYIAFTSPSNQQSPVMHSNDIGLWYGDLSSSHNLLLTVRAILSYVTAIKCPIFDEKNMCQVIEKYKVTWVFLESSMCNQLSLYLLIVYDVSCLKSLIFSDTTIKRRILENLARLLPNVSIIQTYSTSETGMIAYQQKGSKIGSSGYVSKNVQVKFVDMQTEEKVGPNVWGKIWCKTPYTLNTEYNQKRNNLNSIKSQSQFQGWYYTTDIGYYDTDGNIFVVDKDRNIIKYKDKLVSATVIEEMLQRHPTVHEVAVVPVQHSNDGQHPRAYVKKKSNVEVTKEKLIQFVANNLPDSHKLRGGLFFIIGKMPRLPNEKLDKARIISMSCEDD